MDGGRISKVYKREDLNHLPLCQWMKPQNESNTIHKLVFAVGA